MIFSGDEFDQLVEMVTAVFFMFIGFLGTAIMIRQLDPQVNNISAVDKVHMNTADFMGDNYPFQYTGYQAYMFAWMMDGEDETALTWVSEPDAQFPNPSASSHSWITLAVGSSPSGFLVRRNRAIIGSEEGQPSIRDTLKKAGYYMSYQTSDASPDGQAVRHFYNPTVPWSSSWRSSTVRLDFTDGHNCKHDTPDGTPPAFPQHVNRITNSYGSERYNYVWMLHPCEQLAQ